jgi:hypothetical protein
MCTSLSDQSYLQQQRNLVLLVETLQEHQFKLSLVSIGKEFLELLAVGRAA